MAARAGMTVDEIDERALLADRSADPTLLTALAEAAAEADRAGQPDLTAVALLREAGLLGLAAPREYGGAGADAVALNATVANVASANASASIMLFQHYAVTARIAEWGTAEQKVDLLPRAAAGTWLLASAWSETGAGANKKNLSTQAVPDGDGWLISGAKAFTTSAGVADLYLVLAQCPQEETAQADTGYGAAGQTFFLIHRDNPGLAPDTSMFLEGMRGSATGFVQVTECQVSDGDRLGEIGAATRIIAGVRESGVTLGAVALGITEAAVDAAYALMTKRGQLADPVVRRRLVDLSTELEASRAMVERAGRRESAQVGVVTLHSKVFASTVAERLTAEVLRLLGSAGYIANNPVNRYARDARAVALMGPTNDLCRELVGMSWQ